MTVALDSPAGISCEFGPRERFLLERLDGLRTLSEVSAEYLAAFGRQMETRSWIQFLGLMGSRGLLEPATRPTMENAAQGLQPTSSSLAAGRWVIGPAAGIVSRADKLTRWAHRPTLKAASVLACLIMIVHVGVVALHHNSWNHTHFTIFDLVIALIITQAIICIHELGHGIAAVRYGARAVEFGIQVRPPLILFYCRIVTKLAVPLRRNRVIIDAAGVACGLTALLVVYAIWLVSGATTDTVFVVLVVAIASQLVNFLPIPPFDGFGIVEDATGTIDLNRESRSYVGRVLGRRGLRDKEPVPRSFALLAFGVIAAQIVFGLIVLFVILWAALHLGYPGGYLLLAGCLVYSLSQGAVIVFRRISA